MIAGFLQFVCTFLLAIGLMFILIDLRTKFDQSFRFFGFSLILLCLMTSIDLWIYPAGKPGIERLYWERIYQGIASMFIVFSIWYLLVLCRSPWVRHAKLILFVGSLMTIANFTDGMMKVSDGKFSTGPLYIILFLPYVLLYIIASHVILIQRMRAVTGSEKKILKMHLFAFGVLFLFGFMDILYQMNVLVRPFMSYTIVGVLAYGLVASLIFSERFVMLLMEKEDALKNLKTAYTDLEQVSGLKQLGESAAIINHEIKNFTFMIGGNAQILAEFENLSEKGKKTVGHILNSVERISNFSHDILEMAKMRIVKEKLPFSLIKMIQKTIEDHFSREMASFKISSLAQNDLIYADWQKLEHAFVNIFKNAKEASENGNFRMEIRVESLPDIVVVSFEDFGPGCNEEQMEGLFKAFYTSKKGKGGTGLGMSITRTIVEGHGGRISAYSKNLAHDGRTGLVINMTFPLCTENSAPFSSEGVHVVLVKEGLNDPQAVQGMFRSLKKDPIILENLNKKPDLDLSKQGVLVVASALIPSIRIRECFPKARVCLLGENGGRIYALPEQNGAFPESLSEELIVKLLSAPFRPEGNRLQSV